MTRIFLDACIVIDLFEAKPEQQKVLTDALLGKTPYGSELVRMEARLQAVRDGRDELLARYDGYFERCRLVPFSRPLFDLASQLRIHHRIKTPDALHLAAAMMGACEQFWTNDDRLAKAAEKGAGLNLAEPIPTQAGMLGRMQPEPVMDIAFFGTESGVEPVRDWLRMLTKADKSIIGADLKTVQYGWPIGMPVVRKLESGLWELRSHLDRRIARKLFKVCASSVVLLHGFIKKSQKTPADDLTLVRRRRALVTPEARFT